MRPSSIAQLPEAIPIFPLAGVLLLPFARLPLNIFEPRYLAMVRHALATDWPMPALAPVTRATAPSVRIGFSVMPRLVAPYTPRCGSMFRERIEPTPRRSSGPWIP